MLFHPRPDRPTEPNAGILRLAPGAHHPIHNHDFAQVWYVLEGTFVIDGRKQGTLTVKFKPSKPGPDKLTGTFKLSVCSDKTCEIEAPKIALDVTCT